MSRMRFAILAILVTGSTIGLGWGIGRWRKPTTDSQADGNNRASHLFRQHCASCHGNDGRADGVSVPDLHPPPRDFLARPWRFEATIGSIKRVTVDGIPGTAMPAFRGTLSDAEIDLVASYAHVLATRGPTVEYVPTAEEKLLRDSGFVDMRGIEPPPLTLSDSKGNKTKLADYRGKVVVLHFWGTGCVHCIKEMPALNDLQKSNSGRMVLFHVCADEEDAATAQKVLDRLAPGTTSFTEPTGIGLARFETQTLPTVWLIAPTGKVIGRATGARDWHAPSLLKLIQHWLPT
jgi:mono/diheme cytochrome c family protein